jgi:1-acyl-sn-glycerol-3-phosphate acyltransferase
MSRRLRLPTLPYGAFRGALRLFMRSRVSFIGVRNVPDGPCIACSNHPNREEILLGYLTFTRRVRIMVQHGLLDPRFLQQEYDKALAEQYRFPRWFSRLGPPLSDLIARQNQRLGCIPVVREEDEAPNALSMNRRGFRQAIAALERGEVVGMAPEGTISPTGGVGQLQRGAAWMAWHFARRGRPMPVLPIIFYGIGALDTSLFARQRLVVAVSEPMYLEVAGGEERGVALERFTRRLQTRLQEQYDAVDRMYGRLAGDPPARRRRRAGQAPRTGTGRTVTDPSGAVTSSSPAS